MTTFDATTRIVTGCDGQGRDWATHGHYRADSAAALARLLVAAGVPDQPWETRTAAGTRSLFGPSLHGLAGLVAEESSLRWRRYRPFAGVPSSADRGAADLPSKLPRPAGRGRPISASTAFPVGDTGQAAEVAGGASPPLASATITMPRVCAPALPLPRARLQPKKETDHAR